MTAATIGVRRTDQRPIGVRSVAGWWRLAALAPPVAGSALLVVTAGALLAGHPAWAYAPLAGWLGGAAAVLTRSGERAMVRVVCGYRHPSAEQAEPLRAALTRVTAAASIQAARVDVYVCRGRQVNAFAVGGHSVAVSQQVLKDCAARPHGRVVLEALLAHELGHLAQAGSRFVPAACWLAGPWRLVAGAVVGVCWVLAGRPRLNWLLGLEVAAALVLAVAGLGGQGRWGAAVGLGIAGLCVVGCPLLTAAACRRSEHAADAFAAACGYGPALALLVTHVVGRRRPTGFMGRLLVDHPDPTARARALDRGARSDEIRTGGTQTDGLE